MALSLAELMILCLLVEYLLQRIHVPPLIGMLAVGAVLGPQILGLLDPDLIRIGSDLRMIALIVILLRAGLELSRESLHKVGLQAILLAFLPAVFEAALIIALAPGLLSISRGESVLLACVLAAVSPAVVVPMMVQFIKEGRGTKKAIPTLVLAGASLDDVTVIVAYSIVLSLYLGDAVNVSWMIASIPLSLVFAVIVGYLIARFLIKVFERYNPRATKRAMTLLAIAIALVHIGDLLEASHIPFAALLAVMAIGFIILEKRESMAHELSSKLGKIWVFAQIVLFAMVGAQVDLNAAKEAGFAAILLILIALVSRSMGTYLCTLGSGFSLKEKLFVVISYLPKATVQAAIGSAPLAAMAERGMDTRPGQIILAVAVMSIIVTAPLGAFAISWGGRHLLSVDESEGSSSSALEASEAEYDLLKD
ncbi:cation:proton antiporter [uncultured Sphaerochaeta sp.]|uniref:cation:proton antiporter domain-containing protein n=1 Tax=uncultured Sphaerochaeta sp. TaxID=886478 RepID=UPI0029CA6078|nr:cation:proton antiporter [uncultured Sphaerochaeta sp.]